MVTFRTTYIIWVLIRIKSAECLEGNFGNRKLNIALGQINIGKFKPSFLNYCIGSKSTSQLRSVLTLWTASVDFVKTCYNIYIYIYKSEKLSTIGNCTINTRHMYLVSSYDFVKSTFSSKRMANPLVPVPQIIQYKLRYKKDCTIVYLRMTVTM